MCVGPEVAIALALTGAGHAVQAYEANSSLKAQQKAKDAAFMAEQTRQKGYQADAGKAFNDTLSKFQPDQQQKTIGDMIFQRNQNIENASPAADIGSYGATTTNAPKVVASDLASRLEGSQNKATTNANNLSKLKSFGDLIFSNSQALNTGGQDINRINNFSSNSANINQAEQSQAYSNAKKNPSMIGDLLNLAGSAAGADAFTGGAGAARVGSWWDSGANIVNPMQPGQFGPAPLSIFG